MTKANFIYPHTLPDVPPRAEEFATRWTDVPLPPVAHRPGPLHVAPGEEWCAHCGAVMMPDDGAFRVRCCSHPTPVAATSVLAEHEYIIIAG